MADDSKPAPEEKKTSADAIADAPKTPRSPRRSIEDRLSFLEDENTTLKERNSTLESSFNDLCKSLKTKPSSNGESDLLSELSEFFNW